MTLCFIYNKHMISSLYTLHYITLHKSYLGPKVVTAYFHKTFLVVKHIEIIET